jgi:hypothetical protein
LDFLCIAPEEIRPPATVRSSAGPDLRNFDFEANSMAVIIKNEEFWLAAYASASSADHRYDLCGELHYAEVGFQCPG